MGRVSTVVAVIGLLLVRAPVHAADPATLTIGVGAVAETRSSSVVSGLSTITYANIFSTLTRLTSAAARQSSSRGWQPRGRS
jgi:hypothetical protein